MLDRLERYRLPIIFLLGFVLTATIWLLIERAHDAAEPLELIATDAPPGGLKVEVTGAVTRPGVYQFEPGARIADALEAAGGPRPDAAPGALNMATRLRDEQSIVVPSVQDAAALPAQTEAPVSPGSDLIDLNSADARLLETLPGIGVVRARNIVDSRSREGAFGSPDDLVTRGLVPGSVLEQIRARVTAASP